MRLRLLDTPQIRAYADLFGRRLGFRMAMPRGTDLRGARVLTFCGPFGGLTPCGLCGAHRGRLFLVRFMSGLETLVGRDCCALRFNLPDWERQVRLALRLDQLVAEQDMLRSAYDRRDDYMEQANAMLDDAMVAVKNLAEFERLYPPALLRELRHRAVSEQSGPVDGLEAWREANPLRMLNRIKLVLGELEELAVADDEPGDETDYDPYDDAFAPFAAPSVTEMTLLQRISREAARIPETLQVVQRTIAAASAFFTDGNIDRLPELMTTDAEREQVLHATRTIRRVAVLHASTGTGGAA